MAVYSISLGILTVTSTLSSTRDILKKAALLPLIFTDDEKLGDA
jgi:hypothetical protein